MIKNKTLPREMQALRSQSYHKRKMKKILKAMIIFSNAPSKMKSIIFSNAPSTMKSIAQKKMMTNINLILFRRTTRMSPGELFHQEVLSQPSSKISFLAIVFLAIILVIKH
jgi:hypothetical protein